MFNILLVLMGLFSFQALSMYDEFYYESGFDFTGEPDYDLSEHTIHQQPQYHIHDGTFTPRAQPTGQPNSYVYGGYQPQQTRQYNDLPTPNLYPHDYRYDAALVDNRQTAPYIPLSYGRQYQYQMMPTQSQQPLVPCIHCHQLTPGIAVPAISTGSAVQPPVVSIVMNPPTTQITTNNLVLTPAKNKAHPEPARPTGAKKRKAPPKFSDDDVVYLSDLEEDAEPTRQRQQFVQTKAEEPVDERPKKKRKTKLTQKSDFEYSNDDSGDDEINTEENKVKKENYLAKTSTNSANNMKLPISKSMVFDAFVWCAFMKQHAEITDADNGLVKISDRDKFVQCTFDYTNKSHQAGNHESRIKTFKRWSKWEKVAKQRQENDPIPKPHAVEVTIHTEKLAQFKDHVQDLKEQFRQLEALGIDPTVIKNWFANTAPSKQ